MGLHHCNVLNGVQKTLGHIPASTGKMVVTILRVGTNAKYSDGWAAAFGGKKASTSKPTVGKAKAKVTVKAAKKKASPKKSAKKKKK
jgi:hypothetical protein